VAYLSLQKMPKHVARFVVRSWNKAIVLYESGFAQTAHAPEPPWLFLHASQMQYNSDDWQCQHLTLQERCPV